MIVFDTHHPYGGFRVYLEVRVDVAMSDPDEDYSLLISAVRDAGALAMQYFGKNPTTWEKPGGTVVSDADIAVDGFLRARLVGARPDYGWLSEETEDDRTRLARRRAWVVDPIDGTRAFLDGLPHFCQSVALIEDRRPIMAALFNPAADEFYEASIGHGAKLNGKMIQVSTRSQIAGCRMATFAPMFRHPAWREAWPEMDVIQRDSVAYRIALVASAAVDCRFRAQCQERLGSGSRRSDRLGGRRHHDSP
jgi:myo-inositol-1(or 4)-monophosphatase